MKKKFIFSMIVACSCCLVFVGCGRKKEQAKDKEIVTQQEQETEDKSTESEDKSVVDDTQEKDCTSLKKPSVSQDTWEDTEEDDKTQGDTSQADNSSKDDKQNTEDKGNVNDDTKDESTDSEETTEPSLNIDGDSYFPLLP